MRLGTCFSGIGAPELATRDLGWESVFCAETEPFPSAVLAARWPHVPNLGDVTAVDWRAWRGKVDVMVGGPPCQDFSVAGKRVGLDGARGNLSLTWVEILNAVDPTWSVTENVPGWLSDRGNAFGTFLGALVGGGGALLPPGGGWRDAGVVVGPARSAAWRVLDAQHFGVPQRRRRVFIVAGRTGTGADPVAVLFERKGVCRDRPARGETGEAATGASRSAPAQGGEDRERIAHAVTCHQAKAGDPTADNYVAHSLRGEGFDASEDGTGRETPLVASTTGAGFWQEGVAALRAKSGASHETLLADPITANEANTYCNAGNNPRCHNVVAFDPVQATHPENRSRFDEGAPCHSLARDNAARASLAVPSGVRRMTPRECERLQGMPAEHTLIIHRGKPAADGPRYCAIGNSMAVPVVRWICCRIQKAHILS